jgi:hypothetical protein
MKDSLFNRRAATAGLRPRLIVAVMRLHVRVIGNGFGEADDLLACFGIKSGQKHGTSGLAFADQFALGMIYDQVAVVFDSNRMTHLQHDFCSWGLDFMVAPWIIKNHSEDKFSLTNPCLDDGVGEKKQSIGASGVVMTDDRQPGRAKIESFPETFLLLTNEGWGTLRGDLGFDSSIGGWIRT